MSKKKKGLEKEIILNKKRNELLYNLYETNKVDYKNKEAAQIAISRHGKVENKL